MTYQPKIVAVDGPAAAGKGTLCRRLAEKYNLATLDTGLLYRAVGMNVVRAGFDPEDADKATEFAEKLTSDDLQAGDLRTEDAGQAASKVSAVPGVRQALLDFQKNFAVNPPESFSGAILDGRDIGTVICPDADVKVYINASAEIRAERRHKELLDRGLESIYARVLEEMKERDARDSSRSVAPLKPAEDALQLDTSDKDADQVFAEVIDFIASKAE